MPGSEGVIDVHTLLHKAGIDARTIEAVTGIDALMQNWRRRAAKRELGHKALVDLKIGIDLAQLDVLCAIEAPADEFGEMAGGETMVASVAERLAIDPSRASRIVAEMVEMGHARRAVSQADARRTIVELTASGRAVVAAVRAYKFLIMGDFFSEWSAEELGCFLPLLRKFAKWSEHSEPAAAKFAAEIEMLAQEIASSRLEAVPS